MSYASLVIGARAEGSSSLRPVLSLEDAVREAELVVDFVPDELESKLEILSLLDRMAPPRAIFATPTRALSIRDLASCTYRPELVVGLRLPADEPGPHLEVGLEHPPEALPEVLAELEAFWVSLGATVQHTADLEPLP